MTKLRSLGALLLVLLAVPVLASAATAKKMATLSSFYVMSAESTATVTDLGSELPDDAISWYWNENKGYYVLFLPSWMDASRLRVCFTGAESVTVGDRTLYSGDVTDVFVPGGKVTLTCGRQSRTVMTVQSAGVATVCLTTASGGSKYIEAKKGRKETGTVQIRDEAGEVVCAQELTYVRVRGESSFAFKKKSYQFKLTSGKNLFDMGKCKTWTLQANYRDQAVIRNAITFDMARYVGLDYTPQYVFVDVYVAHEYKGLYMLCERV